MGSNRIGAQIEAIDEYDDYLVWAAFQFTNGASIAEVAVYLKWVADVHMYVGSRQDACERTAAQIERYVSGVRGDFLRAFLCRGIMSSAGGKSTYPRFAEIPHRFWRP